MGLKRVTILIYLVLLSGTFSEAALTIEDNSFKVTDTTWVLRLTEALDVKFDITYENDDTTSTADVTDLQLYLTDKEDLKTTTKDVQVADKSTITEITFPATVGQATDGDNPGKKAETGAKASITIPSTVDCEAYSHLCAVLIPGNDIACIELSSNTDCTGVTIKDGSFAVTPTDFTLKVSEATEITFSLTLSNDAAIPADGVDVTDIQLYLSDNADFAATEKEVKVADKDSITGPNFNIKVGAGTKATPKEEDVTDAKTSVTIPSANCADFNVFCALIKPGDHVVCFSLTDKTDCTASDPTTAAPATTSAPDDGAHMLSSTALMLVSMVGTLFFIV